MTVYVSKVLETHGKENIFKVHVEKTDLPDKILNQADIEYELILKEGKDQILLKKSYRKLKGRMGIKKFWCEPLIYLIKGRSFWEIYLKFFSKEKMIHIFNFMKHENVFSIFESNSTKKDFLTRFSIE